MIKRVLLAQAIILPLFIGSAGAQQYPMLDDLAQKVIQRYQQATCEQLWMRKAEPKSEMAQKLIAVLQNNPRMRRHFLNKVAAPIANKLFECGLLP